MATLLVAAGGGGCHRRVVGNRFIILIGPKSQSTPSGWYVGDVPIEQPQPSNGPQKGM